jgi:hypothetical protein
VAINQKEGRIIRPKLGQIIRPPDAATALSRRGIYTPLLLQRQATCPSIEEHHIWSHQIHKISSLTHPKSMIFEESKEKALIYISIEAIYFPLSFV